MSSSKREDFLWIIDCDPGCDDAIALALAADKLRNEDVKILTVAGNVGVDLTTWNACRVLAACGRAWPVHRGCARSLSGEATPAASVHGRDGLGDVPNDAIKATVRPPRKSTAVTELLKLVKRARAKMRERRFVLICTGPLANLATALNLMTESEQLAFWARCQQCVVMGGAFDVPGNITAAAEFNIHFDPVAARMVLESWRVAHEKDASLAHIRFVPLDITETVGIPLASPTDKTEAQIGSSHAVFLRAALRKYGMFHAWFCARPRKYQGDLSSAPIHGIEDFREEPFLHARMRGKGGLDELKPFCFLHDPLAVWLALGGGGKDGCPNHLLWSKRYVSVDTGYGSSRGSLLHHREKAEKDNPSREPMMGTEVEWITAGAFDNHRDAFVNAIKDLLAIAR